MKSQIIYGRNPVGEAMGEKIDRIYLQKGLKDKSIGEIRRRARELKIQVFERDKRRLDEMVQGENHQGVVAYISDFVYATVEDILRYAESRGEDPLILLLDGIEDPHNLGAIIRSAHVFGVHGVIIPKNRSARITDTVYKTSAGAVDHMKVAMVTNLSRTVEELKKANIWTYGADLSGTSLYETDLTGPIAIVIGNEGKGISQKLGEKLDGKFRIPMAGDFDSLNASVATGITLYEIRRQIYGKG